ncbi:aspartate aminotransferase family protein [Fictibacillus barbaricus]|uniref:Adenosylmethionine-8-amino-7-oxononanoate aminotransferase n=1 Tax=Fictibacillus barbaricus TaxID=182136 RepID=A0ABU1TYL1_9BACL|nr:aspartate aminotransferase family protein [Fictibacillus barbaricus]MDR7072293.1 adenosylmethionine-8-amino-7-oxononanoate aminotransferase [Fictibacillus barbaricus]
MRKSHLIKPVLGNDYPVISHGKGIYLYDKDGKQYIDGSSGAITANIGHGVEEIAEAMWNQAKHVSFVYRSQFTNEAAERLAEKLAEYAPGDLNSVFFVNSGSEATETALKIAIQYFQEQGIHTKNKVLSRWTSYHGITLGALSMSGHPLRRQRFSSLLEDFPVAPAPYCYQCPLKDTYPGCGVRCADELETIIQAIGPEQIAAFIVEPVIGASGGAIVPPDEYYTKIRSICTKFNILMIADEVMTGMGRTGKMFAMEHWDVIPDIITLGKGMSAGYTPMAATIISDRVMKEIENGSKIIMGGHTFSANPQSAAACLAVIQFMERNSLIENTETIGEYLLNSLQRLQWKHSIIGDIRGKGLLCGVEFVKDPITREPFEISSKVTERLLSICFEKGLLVYPAVGGVTGFSGDSILVSPPLIITKEQVNDIIDILDHAVGELTSLLITEGLYITKATS